MSNSPGSLIPLFKIKVEEKGRIKDIKEIIVRIDGLPTCLNGQILDMGDGIKGIIMGFDEDEVLALVLGEQSKLRMGKEIKGISEPFKIPVGDVLIGRMVTALGEPCDNAGKIETDKYLPVFRNSPTIPDRLPIDTFISTGTKVVDIVIPIAKGQRQLILGDRMTGKTTIGIDAIINQKGKDVICIYCCIGKSGSGLEKVVTSFSKAGVLDYTVIVAATDSSPVGEQYIVPFSAISIGEYFASTGKDVLIIFDDLTKHAWAYRQLSLLMERPPGREAYPGDIFYVQTQLMERAGKFNEELGNGTLTFIGIAETLQGDLTGYIPSNLSSMCDGQIYLSSTIFAEGIRPAIDIAYSLSIVGGKTQPQVIKTLGLTLRSDIAKSEEVLRLSKISSGISETAEKIIKKGEAIKSILQQNENMPVSIAEIVLLLYAVDNSLLVSLSAEARAKFSEEIYTFACTHNQGLMDKIEEELCFSSEIENGIKQVMSEYFSQYENIADQ